MADSRITGLAEVNNVELNSLYNSLVLGVDDPSYSAADTKKLKVATLLTDLNNLITQINGEITTLNTNKADSTAVTTEINDSFSAKFLHTGSYYIGSVLGTETRVVDFNKSVGTTDYQVVFTLEEAGVAPGNNVVYTPVIKSKAQTSFSFLIGVGGSVQNLRMRYTLIKL